MEDSNTSRFSGYVGPDSKAALGFDPQKLLTSRCLLAGSFLKRCGTRGMGRLCQSESALVALVSMGWL